MRLPLQGSVSDPVGESLVSHWRILVLYLGLGRLRPMTERQGLPRLTAATVAVLRVLIADPTREAYGLQVCAAAGLPTGTVHPILARDRKSVV